MKSVFSFMAILVSSTSFAQISNWQHLNFQSVSGESISVDYTLNYQYEIPRCGNCSAPIKTDSLWFNLSNENLKTSDRVQVVLVSINEFSNGRSRQDLQRIDLKPTQHGTFTGKAESIQVFDTGFSSSSYRQEFSVVVNGRWLVDPVNGSNNFHFQLNK